MKQKTIIVIPVYKANLDKFEEICLRRCNEILSNCPKALVFPKGLDTSAYASIFGNGLQLVPFSEKYFKSIQAYNSLLTSLQFYKSFEAYEHMLLHQSDAYVFKDELDFWCNKGFDYIGAPIYEFDGTIRPINYIGVGNGGFSLRNIRTSIKVLTTFKRIYAYNDLLQWYRKYNWKGRIRYLPYLLRMLSGFGGNAHHWLNYSKLNEDVFWGIYVPKAFPNFSIAPFDEGYKFAMEYNCEQLIELNNCQLPFGCHQWYKGDFLGFWQDKIEECLFDKQMDH